MSGGCEQSEQHQQRQSPGRRQLPRTLILAGLLIIVTIPCFAYERVRAEIDEISYSNDGVYQATLLILWESKKSGETHSERFPAGKASSDSEAWVAPGKKQTVNLDKLRGAANSGLNEGDEVWAVVTIAQGDTEDCKKERYKFVYKPGVNARAKYITRGTSQNDNRCRLVNPPRR